ncbi:MAG: GNAT family N-acetyltransferase, partial [Anaerolineales bacterium]
MTHNPEQIQMVWPPGRRMTNPEPRLAGGYFLRTYRRGDEECFFRLMDSVGWAGWDEAHLRPWLYRALPDGWFFAVQKASGKIAATCMATHDPTWQMPFCGEVGWTATHPDHQGKGLGKAVVSAVVARFLNTGYRCVHLYTEHWRDAALKMYLKLGFVPYLDPSDSIKIWEKICARIGWTYEPEEWVADL